MKAGKAAPPEFNAVRPAMSQTPRPSFLRRYRLLLILGLLTLGLWGAYEWLLSSARSRLNDRLAVRGLVLTSTAESWSAWGGITLKQAALRHLSDDGNGQPLLETSALHVDILWQETWSTGDAVTRWQAQDATLVVHDDVGAVTLDHVFTDFDVRSGEIQIVRFNAANGPLTFALKGNIVLAPPASPGVQEGEFELNLRPLRATLNTLRFNPAKGPFHVTGDFTVDRRSTSPTWSGKVRGTGQNVEWRGLPLRDALVQGQVSQAGLDLTCDLALLQGSAQVHLNREGWSQTPLQMNGTLTDTAERRDDFTASYLGSTRTLTVNEISGKADLIELGRTFPPIAAQIPDFLEVKTFPDLIARDFVWPFGEDIPAWSLASLQLRSPADLVLTIRDHPLAVNDLTGRLSHKEGIWHFDDLKGQLLEGRFTLEGDYNGLILSKARVSLRSLRLARLSPWVGKVGSNLDDSDLSLTYSGAICGDPVRSTGSGSLILTNAPVVHIPLIEQAYTLFPKMLPDRGRAGAGSFQLNFSMTKGIAAIDPFKARSEAVTVTATGTVDLVRRRVDGKARANLRGIVGRITLPLSHVFTDMEVSGPLDDIRVTPEGPVGGVKNLLKGTAKAATGGAKLSSGVLREGLTLPFEALGMFGREKKEKPGQ